MLQGLRGTKETAETSLCGGEYDVWRKQINEMDYRCYCEKIEIDADGIWVITSSGVFSVEDFEKTVFLTKEAADAALKEMSE